MFGYDTLRKGKMSDTNLPQLTTGRALSPSHTEGDEDQSLSSSSAAVKRTGVKKKAHSEGSREGSVAQPHSSTTTASAGTVVVVNSSATGPSGRSSVSSLASSGSYSGQHHYHHHHHQQSLNQALAIVANKWDREQRRQEQEITRRLTLLKQRKVSAVLKVGDDVFFPSGQSNLEDYILPQTFG